MSESAPPPPFIPMMSAERIKCSFDAFKMAIAAAGLNEKEVEAMRELALYGYAVSETATIRDAALEIAEILAKSVGKSLVEDGEAWNERARALQRLQDIRALKNALPQVPPNPATTSPFPAALSGEPAAAAPSILRSEVLDALNSSATVAEVAKKLDLWAEYGVAQKEAAPMTTPGFKCKNATSCIEHCGDRLNCPRIHSVAAPNRGQT